MTSFPSGWRPFLAPHTARRLMQSSPSAMLWECPTSRPSGSTKCQTTGTRTMSACTRTSPPSAEPSSTWCTSSSGERSPWSMTTAQVQVQLVSVSIFQCVSVCVCLFHVMMNMTPFKTHSPYTPNCSEKKEVPGELQKAALLLRVQ